MLCTQADLSNLLLLKYNLWFYRLVIKNIFHVRGTCWKDVRSTRIHNLFNLTAKWGLLCRDVCYGSAPVKYFPFSAILCCTLEISSQKMLYNQFPGERGIYVQKIYYNQAFLVLSFQMFLLKWAAFFVILGFCPDCGLTV